MTIHKALTIAGSDSGGGAGIQADLKTFSALGVYGMSVITAVTAQNTRTVSAVTHIPRDTIDAQLRAIAADIPPDAIKTGMLGDIPAITTIVKALHRLQGGIPLVVDPVMVAKSGAILLAKNAIDALGERLVPLATLITPNLPEADVLLGRPPGTCTEPDEATARALLALGCEAVLLKGGHGKTDTVHDLFVTADGSVHLEQPRLQTDNTHGTGCTLSAAITAELAKGRFLEDAVRTATRYVHEAIAHGDVLHVGGGHGPVHHFHRWW